MRLVYCRKVRKWDILVNSIVLISYEKQIVNLICAHTVRDSFLVILDKLTAMAGRILARYLTKEVKVYKKFSAHRRDTLARVLRPGDVLLVEGDHRISSVIKYLTQSTWSHSAFYIGDREIPHNRGAETIDDMMLVEADLEQGVIAVPLSKYADFNIRICRPFNLKPDDINKACEFMISSIGKKYDLKNITDLARYLMPKFPFPSSWRRRMLALGSGDPTRAVCSSLIAQAFHSVHYPILPDVLDCSSDGSRSEILHIRHHSLFAPRDFDVSPYFEVVKPTLELGFDYESVNWYQHSDEFLQTGDSDFNCKACEEYHKSKS